MWEGWLLLQVPVDGTIENLTYIYNDDIDGNDDDDDDDDGVDGNDDDDDDE